MYILAEWCSSQHGRKVHPCVQSSNVNDIETSETKLWSGQIFWYRRETNLPCLFQNLKRSKRSKLCISAKIRRRYSVLDSDTLWVGAFPAVTWQSLKGLYDLGSNYKWMSVALEKSNLTFIELGGVNWVKSNLQLNFNRYASAASLSKLQRSKKGLWNSITIPSKGLRWPYKKHMSFTRTKAFFWLKGTQAWEIFVSDFEFFNIL